MGKGKVLKEGEQVQLDLSTQKWLDKQPSRTEKNKYQFYFNRKKIGVISCNLNRDTHVSERFSLIIREMAHDFPAYEVLDGGISYKATTLYKKLWHYHLYLIQRWKDSSPEKFPKSKNSSNSKTTASSSKMVKQGKTG